MYPPPPFCYWWLIMKKNSWKLYRSRNPNPRGVRKCNSTPRKKNIFFKEQEDNICCLENIGLWSISSIDQVLCWAAERMKLISQQHHPTAQVHQQVLTQMEQLVSKVCKIKIFFSSRQGWLFQSETKVHLTVAYNKQKQNASYIQCFLWSLSHNTI